MSFQVIKEPNIEAVAAAAGEALNKLLASNKDRPVLLLLSSGSALPILEYAGKTSLSEHLTVGMLDDRFSQDAKVNNFSQFQKTDFYKDALEMECAFIGTLPRPEDTIETVRERWEGRLKKWREDNTDGIIIATLGMGADGHTAGIFPYTDDEKKFADLFESEAWTVAYEATGKNQYPQRITTTVTFFKLIDEGIGFVCGPEKKEKLDAVLVNKTSFAKLPAAAWHEIKNVTVYSDIN